jgi:hypothetical protein
MTVVPPSEALAAALAAAGEQMTAEWLERAGDRAPPSSRPSRPRNNGNRGRANEHRPALFPFNRQTEAARCDVLLDLVYAAALVASAAALVTIAVLVFDPDRGRILDRCLWRPGGTPSASGAVACPRSAASCSSAPPSWRCPRHCGRRAMCGSRCWPPTLPAGLSRARDGDRSRRRPGAGGLRHLAFLAAGAGQLAVQFRLLRHDRRPALDPARVMTLGLGIFAWRWLDELVTALTGGRPPSSPPSCARHRRRGALRWTCSRSR